MTMTRTSHCLERLGRLMFQRAQWMMPHSQLRLFSGAAAGDLETNLGKDVKFGSHLTPREIVAQLDRFIVGQHEAKRAVAIALRNRWRRSRVAAAMREEVIPKNILMIGPTGCGKTEIARRVAKLACAPFIKVEATKFTEVGFHGQDVDTIIRDLADIAVHHVRQQLKADNSEKVAELVNDFLLKSILENSDELQQHTKESLKLLLKEGGIDNKQITLQIPQRPGNSGMNENPDGSRLTPQAKQRQPDQQFARILDMGDTDKRKMTIGEAKKLLENVAAERLASDEEVQLLAQTAVENEAIVFIDEIDKIVTSKNGRGYADASAEGVQRDLLPIIEGTNVSTKIGNIKTDHILFICSGAFHSVKPSDMMAELQGRLPIRVELYPLKSSDFERILTDPEFNLIRQTSDLLATEGVDWQVTPTGISAIAKLAEDVNTRMENIGARRLHTIMEKLTENISFSAPERSGERIVIDTADVDRISDMAKSEDFSRYVL